MGPEGRSGAATEREALRVILDYHERTKHRYDRSAKSLGHMDWDNQPYPFRSFEGAQAFQLPIPKRDPTPTFAMLHLPGGIPPRALDAESLSEFFYYSMALSAWKEFRGGRWALRVNPSSGNLHPTEAYLLLPTESTGVAAGLYHYSPLMHALERRAAYPAGVGAALTKGLPEGAFLAGLSSIPWREAWKYGERAYRYCQHDVGHALAALRFSAALMGWRIKVLGAVPDEELDLLLGAGREDSSHEGEREHAQTLIAVVPSSEKTADGWKPPTAASLAASVSAWEGKANRLSREHQDWGLIEEAAGASRALLPVKRSGPKPRAMAEHPPLSSLSAGRVIRGRRSAVRMDEKSGLKARAFFGLLTRLDPALAPVPWDALDWPASVHPVFFVHRVDGLEPGLYIQAREKGKLEALKAAMRKEFLWKRPKDAPRGLQLFLLEPGDVRALAKKVSCGQDIAADGAFSAGMLAEFEPMLEEYGAGFYRNLHWECGAIGQVLYLEAEAAGLRGTGIGCFFDDPVHEALGIEDRRFQSLYHFTVGGPVEDERLTTSSAYPSAVDR